MPRAPRQLPSLPPPNRANPAAGANSGLDKTWGQGHTRSRLNWRASFSGGALSVRLKPIQFGQGRKHGLGLRPRDGVRPDTRSTDDPSLVEDVGGRHWQHPKGGSGEIKAAVQETALYLRRHHGHQAIRKAHPKIYVGEDFQIQLMIAFKIAWQVSSLRRYGNCSGAGSADSKASPVKSA